MKRLTLVQKDKLRFLFAHIGSYMPYADERPTFDALERRGLVKYQRVEDGHKLNGYVLSDCGRSAAGEQTP